VEITVKRETLLRALQMMQGVVESRSSAMPILQNVLIETDGKKKFRVLGTNLDISLKAAFEAEVGKAGKTTLNARRFFDIVRELPEVVEFSVEVTKGRALEELGIRIEVNGNGAGTLRTETKPTLGPSPEEFRIDAGGSQMSRLDFPKGSQLSFQLQYSASSAPLPAGPSGSSTFHYYGDLYRSRVDFVTNPFNLTLTDLKVQSDHINVTEIVKEAFGVDPALRVLSLTFNGPTNSVDHHVKIVNTLIDPINGTTIVWNWDFAQQGGVSSGLYTVAISGGYAGAESNYSNVTTVELKFPKGQDTGGRFLPGLSALGVAAGLLVAAGAAAFGPVRVGQPPRQRP